MAGLEFKERFVISTSDFSFNQLEKSAPEEVAETIKDAGVIILPSHGTNDSFYSGSLDILDYLNDNEITADIYTNDDDYREISLHAADIWLGTFFIKYFAIPIFCSVIASYVYDKLKASEDDKISLKFIAEDKEGRTSTVNFDGKAKDLNKALEAIKRFNNED